MYLTDRKENEENKSVRGLLQKDIVFLDQMQTEMATARQFLMIGRCKNTKPEQVFQTANRLEKIISEQGFEVRRLKKPDIKRFLALYFDASFNGEQMPDGDGEQYVAYMEPVEAVKASERQVEISRPAPKPEKATESANGGIELGGGFGGFGGFERDGWGNG